MTIGHFILIYIDTSVWIAQHTPEIRTDAVNAWFDAAELDEMLCSDWVKTEYASGMGNKLRRGDISPGDFDEAHRKFALLCEAGPRWIEVGRNDFLQAAKLCGEPTSALRAGDALHLAVALRAGCRSILSLDKVFNRNAAAHGLELIEL